jgi:hypothetical protein
MFSDRRCRASEYHVGPALCQSVDHAHTHTHTHTHTYHYRYTLAIHSWNVQEIYFDEKSVYIVSSHISYYFILMFNIVSSRAAARWCWVVGISYNSNIIIILYYIRKYEIRIMVEKLLYVVFNIFFFIYIYNVYIHDIPRDNDVSCPRAIIYSRK